MAGFQRGDGGHARQRESGKTIVKESTKPKLARKKEKQQIKKQREDSDKGLAEERLVQGFFNRLHMDHKMVRYSSGPDIMEALEAGAVKTLLLAPKAALTGWVIRKAGDKFADRPTRIHWTRFGDSDDPLFKKKPTAVIRIDRFDEFEDFDDSDDSDSDDFDDKYVIVKKIYCWKGIPKEHRNRDYGARVEIVGGISALGKQFMGYKVAAILSWRL